MSADSQNQGKTVVDINLVPLGEKFDNTTVMLTCEGFWQKKVPLDRALFGSYDVLYINYPEIPSSLPSGSYMGSGPSGSVEGLPITADFVNQSQKLNPRTIAIIALSGFMLVLVCIGAYIVRQAAKSIVASGFAHRCVVQVSYAISAPEPLSVFC